MNNHPHTHNHKSEAGFSLIELMVVMVIIGLMTSAAVVLVPEQTPPLMESARKTASTVTALVRQSVMSGQVYAIDLRDGKIDARFQTQSGWVAALNPANQDSVFAAVATLNVDGQSTGKTKAENDFLPQIWILPTGEFQPFQMIAETDSGHIRLNAAVGRPIEVTFDAQ